MRVLFFANPHRRFLPSLFLLLVTGGMFVSTAHAQSVADTTFESEADQLILLLKQLPEIYNPWFVGILAGVLVIAGPVTTMTSARLVFRPDRLFVRTLQLIAVNFGINILAIGFYFLLGTLFGENAIPVIRILSFFLNIYCGWILPTQIYDGTLLQGCGFVLLGFFFYVILLIITIGSLYAHVTEPPRLEQINRLWVDFISRSIKDEIDYGQTQEEREAAALEAQLEADARQKQHDALQGRYEELKTRHQTLDPNDPEAVERYTRDSEEYQRDLQEFNSTPE